MKKYRPLLSALVLVLTFGIFAYYLKTHPGTLSQLRNLGWVSISELLGLYLLFLGALALILHYSLELCHARLNISENLLLTAYSSIVNFFGPLQSGPGFRAVYLNRRHQVSYKKYIIATFYYYGFFAIFSAAFLFVGNRAWWQTFLAIAGVSIVCYTVLTHSRKLQGGHLHAHLASFAKLGLVTFLQVLLVAVIYYTELHTVNPHIGFGQALTYTGAANFALFVSLTPGAIGFRESFLLFSQRLHHINSKEVLAASVIDRAVYVAFLGVTFLLILVLNAREKLAVQRFRSVAGPDDAE